MISVIMSVFNTAKYVGEAIESVLKQTYTNFEFIIVDDASTDNSLEIIRKYESQDPRVIVITNEVNLGISKSRNRGLAIARGEYIANMDSDDINMVDRFELQVNHFASNPDTLVLGGRHKVIDAQGNEQPNTWSFPENVFRWDTLTTKVAVTHGCMTTRTDYLREIGGYPEGLENAIDRALFQKMALAPEFCMRNLDDVIYTIRIHRESTSKKKTNLQLENSRRVRKQAIEDILGRTIPEDEFVAIFEKEPGYVSPELSRRAITMYVVFYKKYLKRFRPSTEEREHARKILVRQAFGLARKYPQQNSVNFVRLFTIDPKFFINRLLGKFRLPARAIF